ncbi:MAG: hypothetical protein KIY12_01115 [Thermoplasmata archaeon]|uniref:Uncharacterized protein n=1 Tax=Candidatus Sysuiplasma superficiale TaxID=2823368 RepID=A0A8J8CFP4_9ARCH|nr:hypothetical protein [Candidatus Sysuiplasma superficiale]MBX8643319.1 hypothetical protein [Candidatus Sysuiplasma superficiale]MCL4346352.1 hypothetical protein [Candidatus Thermoplasmatota archaeon]
MFTVLIVTREVVGILISLAILIFTVAGEYDIIPANPMNFSRRGRGPGLSIVDSIS